MPPDPPHSSDRLTSDRAEEVPRLAGRPALLLSAEVLTSLQRVLSESVGSWAARATLTKMGCSEGRKWAAAGDPPTGTEQERSSTGLKSVGERSGWLQLLDESEDGSERRSVKLVDSHEARLHLSDFGKAPHPVCSTLSGFLSGFFSQQAGRDIVAVERMCQACGAAACQFEMRPREIWEEHAADSCAAGPRASLDLLPARNMQTPPETRARSRETGEVGAVGLVTQSPEMQAAIRMAQRLAKVDTTVLISGESGTGKERIARLLHDHSARRDKPFIAVNCGAIPEGLIESELFGHARGSFTGAIQAHVGMFEAADQGTILLDEIGEISPSLQLKLLRVLQEREVRRVGEERSRAVDFRVIAATNRNLAERAEQGLFRQDLYYRLHVVEIVVPPLRARREDILPLARELLESAAARMNRTIDGFSAEVADHLLDHPWPGNVRELENAMERAVALANGARVELADLPGELADSAGEAPKKLESVRPLQDISRDYILAALDLNFGNQTHTARQLGIGTATLYRKLKRYGYLDTD